MPKDNARILFIDLLRGLALLVMIEVHVFNGFLYPELKATNWFYYLNFINGLVAPSFLFVSGFVFQLSSYRGLEELRSFGLKFRKKLARIGMIFLAGYTLHLPYFSLTSILHKATPQQLIGFYNTDILQCIGTGLLILFFARLFIKSDKIYNGFILVAALLFILLGPIMWHTDFTNVLPVPIADYLNPLNGSNFPLFPWLGFLLGGAVICKYYLDYRNNDKEREFIRTITFIGIIAALAGYAGTLSFMPDVIRAIKPNPFFFMFRFGIVLALMGFCKYYFDYNSNSKNFILDVSRESLMVYFFHLQIIYAKAIDNKSLVDIFGGSFGVLPCILITLLLMIIMSFAAVLWGRYKSTHKEETPKLVGAVLIGLVLVFLMG